jgi:hypothetical protein
VFCVKDFSAGTKDFSFEAKDFSYVTKEKCFGQNTA